MFSCDEKKNKLSRLKRVRSLISMYETMRTMFESMNEIEFDDVKKQLDYMIKSMESENGKVTDAAKKVIWKPQSLN